jgi:hypothetical protein
MERNTISEGRNSQGFSIEKSNSKKEIMNKKNRKGNSMSLITRIIDLITLIILLSLSPIEFSSGKNIILMDVI